MCAEPVRYADMMAWRTWIGKLFLACLLGLPAQAQAQEKAAPIMLEAGIVGGNSIACPGHYMGIEGRVLRRASVYGAVETYRCSEVPKTSSRLGVSVRLGPSGWLVRPAVRSGLEYDDDGDISHTLGASLTFGRRYGARFTVERWTLSSGSPLVLLQIGGYVSF